MTVTLKMNDDGYERTKHGGRHVEVSGAIYASTTARGGHAAKPPRLSLELMSQKSVFWSFFMPSLAFSLGRLRSLGVIGIRPL